MDNKGEVEIKKELLDSSENFTNNGQSLEQDACLNEMQEKNCFQFVDVKSEIKVKDEPLDVEEETENSKLSHQISGLEENKLSTKDLETRTGNVDQENCSKVRNTSRNRPQTSVAQDESSSNNCQENFSCRYCNLSFKRKDELKSHLKTHNNKKFTCPHCNHECNDNSKLKRHLLIHSNKKASASKSKRQIAEKKLIEPVEDMQISSDESEVDIIEIESIYDSDQQEEYVPDSEESDEDEDLPDPSDSSTSRTEVRKRKRFKRDYSTLEECIHTLENRNYVAKDGHVWSTHPSATDQRRISNAPVPDFESKPTTVTQQAKTKLQCFQLFFDDAFFSNLVSYTNYFINSVNEKYKNKGRVIPTSSTEMKAFIGILIMAGAKKDNHVAISELWDPKFGFGHYRTAMSEGRFNFLLRCLRFDDANTRAQRVVNDKFAAIRDLWNFFILKCTTNYEPGKHITIDEQLLGFKGKCGFRKYIENNAAKYGIKLVMACDAKTNYVLNSIPYLGSHTKPPKGMSVGEYFATELVKPYYRSGRSVTTDNWFTSYSLAQSLHKKGLTICGTLRVKPYVPKEMLDVKAIKTHTSAFLYDSNTTLVSYRPKEKKVVLLLSTEHKEGNISTTRKPEIVEHYNNTKGGVDKLHQMCSTYSCSRKTKRWPLCVFYGILNIGTINSYIIYNYKCKANSEKVWTRRQFMLELAMDLMRENAIKRHSSKLLPRELRSLIKKLYDIPEALVSTPTADKYVRCFKCDSKSDSKTKHLCASCKDPICGKHAYWVCCDCLQ